MDKFLVVSFFCLAEGYLNNGLPQISITRHHKGDIFIAQGEKCSKDLCVSVSGGSAVSTSNGDCECKCSSDRPIFRDDLNICVDDIQECSLVPFASGAAINKIPYVFLPLKGQIVYPSADIIISDARSPVCVVSGGQFLGQAGWMNLRNDSGAETPFTLFRDEGRTYLQWMGESSLRMALEGRIILVHLMCKDASAQEEPTIFTPCIAFRVAGNPSVKEMMFATDVHQKEDSGGGLSIREYIAIGVCSLLLAVVYGAAVFLYLHIRKKRHRKGNMKMAQESQLSLGEEGVIKNNPLLQATRHLSFGGHDNAGYISESNSCCSDTDQTSDLLHLDEEDLAAPQNMQTSAIIHPCNLDYGETITIQDSNNIEKLPEENVSIVETLEVKENHPETIRTMGCANGRRKLYFNPSYFEPDLLKAPPPAAMEFLMKIREVIAIAKHKMSAKKFSPSLLGIPEEDGSSKADCSSALSARKDISIVEKGDARKPSHLDKQSGGNFHLFPSELCWPSDTKQKIIRKWLEDVPVMMLPSNEDKTQKTTFQENKILNKSMLWQTNQENPVKEKREVPTPPVRQEKKKTKGRAPPVPPVKVEELKTEKEALKRTAPNTKSEIPPPPPRPPPMPSFKITSDSIPRVQGKDCVPPDVAKNLMDAVIQELTNFKKNDKNSKLKELPGRLNTTTKEKTSPEPSEEKSETTQTVKVDSPKVDKSTPEVKITTQPPQQDDHEYEIILLNADPPPKEGKDLKIYNLPEILSKNERTEGYSLVSEVYVNDGYSCCSGESPPSSYSNMSVESEKVHYDMPNEKPGRLTIHVNDSPERYKTSASESDNFEPDTLDRRPRKMKLLKKRNDANERYSNQRFHDMESCINNPNKSESFTDSLERQSIMLKTNGTFKRNSLEKEIDLLRNFSWGNMESVGSLREIYEAKSRSHKKRTETSSLITINNVNRDHDRLSTLSWSEERRNKLLHRGIVLHIREKESRKHKRPPKSETPPQMPPRSTKPCPSPTPRSRSRSTSPATRSSCVSPSSAFPRSPRCLSPPLPPPRSLPPSPPPRSMCSPPPLIPPRSTSTSPVPRDRPRGTPSSPSCSPRNSIKRSLKGSATPPSCTSPSPSHSTSLSSFSFFSSPPPRPPKTIGGSPLLPPRDTKPPLPPKNVKRHPKPGKFAGRPLPPLPRPPKDHSSSPVPYRDPEALSTHSGASVDSLNSSDYEAFYTLPYEEGEMKRSSSNEKLFKKSKRNSSNAITIVRSSTSPVPHSGRQTGNQRWRDPERKSWRGTDKSIPHRQEDSGYLSTDSESCCQQLMFPQHFSRILEIGSQNSETEESLCDGASESGGESIATDSFFYGNFKKKPASGQDGGKQPEVYPCTLRLSDVEVNSDTERHCIPIMVRP